MKSLHSFSRSESEIETAREREVKKKKNSREFSRNENLAGLCNRREAIMWTEVEIGCIVKAKLTDFATENSYLSNLLLSYLCKHL